MNALADWLTEFADICSEAKPVGQWPGEGAATKLREAATALREPARVTDEMVDRAAKAYDDAAVSEGFVSCCGSDTHTRWMRAALEAALLADGESASA